MGCQFIFQSIVRMPGGMGFKARVLERRPARGFFERLAHGRTFQRELLRVKGGMGKPWLDADTNKPLPQEVWATCDELAEIAWRSGIGEALIIGTGPLGNGR